MVDIKRYLKTIGVTQSDLASHLSISRPTLDSYIEQYEADGKLDKERYNIIFSRLFSSENVGRTEFDARLKSIEYLLDRDKRLNTDGLSPKDADIVSKIHLTMLSDLENGMADGKIYQFILLLLRNYKKNIQLCEYAHYIADLNLKLEDEMSDLDKRYYAFFFKAMSPLGDGMPQFNQASFEEFMKKRSIIQEEKNKALERTRKGVQEKIKELIRRAQTELEEEGAEITEDAVLGKLLNGNGEYRN